MNVVRILLVNLLVVAHVFAQAKEPKTDEAGKKDIVVLTPAAAKTVLQLMKQNDAKYLRVSIGKRGEYKLDLDTTFDRRDDYVGESGGVTILVDKKSSTAVPAGVIVDYLDKGEEKGFKFNAPEDDKTLIDPKVTLPDARKGFKTVIARTDNDKAPVEKPPEKVFQLVKYDAAPGKLAAYLTPNPKDGKKHPAIIWITGGDCNSIGNVWRDADPKNDQSASAFRKAGVVMMFPSLRGGNDNPGTKEGFFGEVDDVLAALAFLSKQEYVDPARIYLGGHSTGGTLVLLVAASTDKFRAVFSFGPVDDVLGYGPQYNPFDLSDRKEARLRAPIRWLHGITSPTFVIEGAGGNQDALQKMAKANKNAKVQFFDVKGANHFNILAPTNKLLAERVLKDTGDKCNLTISTEELSKLFGK